MLAVGMCRGMACEKGEGGIMAYDASALILSPLHQKPPRHAGANTNVLTQDHCGPIVELNQ